MIKADFAPETIQVPTYFFEDEELISIIDELNRMIAYAPCLRASDCVKECVAELEKWGSATFRI